MLDVFADGLGTQSSWASHYLKNIKSETTYLWERTVTRYTKFDGCGNYVAGQKGSSYPCGHTCPSGNYSSQRLRKVEAWRTEGYGDEMPLEIELGTTIEVTKEWIDHNNLYDVRPETLQFNVYRSIDQENWEELTEKVDYVVTVDSKEGNIWKVAISGLIRYDDDGNNYYFKVEEKDPLCFDPVYPNGNYPAFDDNPAYGTLNLTNTLKDINIAGYVWLDGQTGIKPAVPHNGIMNDGETRLKDIVVYLYYKNPETGEISKIAETVTDEKGYYEFKDYEIGYYYTEFYYDGVHYEDTIKIEKEKEEISKELYEEWTKPQETEIIAKAFEDINNNSSIDRRSVFNKRFQTITYKQSNDGTALNYNYADKKSTLITNNDGQTTIKNDFQMTAETPIELVYVEVDNFNLGLVKRGMDIALSTDVYDARVTINGQTTDYKYSGENDIKLVWNELTQEWEIGSTPTSDQVTYNLNLYASDYNYRIRNYINTQDFVEKGYINEGEPAGLTTGADLKVNVIYELNLQNQSTITTRINEVKYVYDEKYTFVGLQDSSYSVQDSGNTLTVNLNGLSLAEGETKTIYLVFEIKETDNAVNLGDFSNKAEITSYSTDEGLIDNDSQPGNFVNDNQVEDDSDTAGGLKVSVSAQERKITGKVFDEDGNNVNDVIVQLIELKPYNGKVYEYIWQETVSGKETGLRLNADGTALEQYSYTKADGYYEFKGFIPGDYIVRFIYGDGKTYDMTDNVIKYNGQDYKSMLDPNYNAEWYNSSSYAEGASVARDNEARRLETMGYSVEVNTVKGLLLKLLGNGDSRVTANTLNLTEKEVLVVTYNYYYDPDITYTKIEDVADDDINNAITKLLKDVVLPNTWMCAETSKIKVAVDTEELTNTSVTTSVNGETTTYNNSITNVNFGLELRPVTKIELEKYITGFKLTAANGQTLVNAYVDVDEYLNGTTDISNKVQGVKDNLTILSNVWQYEVVPTEINTLVDGANLEFEYTLVVKNTGDEDYLSSELVNAYNTSTVSDYKTFLETRATQVKEYIRNGTYRTQLGNSVGSKYYVGGSGASEVSTEVLNIRDYVNNDLTFVFNYEGKVEIDESAPHTHRTLRDDYSMQETTINTILKTTEATGKLNTGENAKMYKIALGKNPISSTGNLEFDTYIAEVMSYTNAAGRRAMTSTPGNAEIIDAEKRDGKSHEIDEADTGRIQIGVATGEDIQTNYIIIISVISGIALIAVGAYIVKRHLLK